MEFETGELNGYSELSIATLSTVTIVTIVLVSKALPTGQHQKDMSQCADITITNIKLSIKLYQNWWDLAELHKHCSSLIGKNAILLGSKLVLKVPNQSKRLIVFPRKKGSSFQHVNLTGISGFDQIEASVMYAQQYLNLEKLDECDTHIDNIWASTSVLLKSMEKNGIPALNLKSFVPIIKEVCGTADISIRFNPEVQNVFGYFVFLVIFCSFLFLFIYDLGLQCNCFSGLWCYYIGILIWFSGVDRSKKYHNIRKSCRYFERDNRKKYQI